MEKTETAQVLRVAVSSQLIQLQQATQIDSHFAEECENYFGSGGTIDGLYSNVLYAQARNVLIHTHQKAISI